MKFYVNLMFNATQLTTLRVKKTCRFAYLALFAHFFYKRTLHMVSHLGTIRHHYWCGNEEFACWQTFLFTRPTIPVQATF